MNQLVSFLERVSALEPRLDKEFIKLLSETVGVARMPVETTCRLLESLLGEPFKVAGGMLKDQVYAWQWRNRIRIAHQAMKKIEADQIAVRVVPPGFLLPLLEACGNVDDPDLQELWARLLADGIRQDSSQHPMFIDVLRRMSALDAQAFKELVVGSTEYHTEAIDDSTGRLVVLGLVYAQRYPEDKPVRLAGNILRVGPTIKGPNMWYVAVSDFGGSLARVLQLDEGDRPAP